MLIQSLVIELGYLEHYLAEGLQGGSLETAIVRIDTAINFLSEHLTPPL